MFFQKDYWSRDDKELEKVALKHGIGAGTSTQGYDRQYAISCLLARDQARKAGITIIATLLSLLATAVNVAIAVKNARESAPATPAVSTVSATSSQTIEARQVIIRDPSNRIVAWLGTAPLNSESLKNVKANTDIPLATAASGNVTGLFFFSENGKTAGSFIPTSDGGVLNVAGEADSTTHIHGDGIELINRKGHMAADFKSWPNSFVDLHDANGQVIWSAEYGRIRN